MINDESSDIIAHDKMRQEFEQLILRVGEQSVRDYIARAKALMMQPDTYYSRHIPPRFQGEITFTLEVILLPRAAVVQFFLNLHININIYMCVIVAYTRVYLYPGGHDQQFNGPL